MLLCLDWCIVTGFLTNGSPWNSEESDAVLKGDGRKSFGGKHRNGTLVMQIFAWKRRFGFHFALCLIGDKKHQKATIFVDSDHQLQIHFVRSRHGLRVETTHLYFIYTGDRKSFATRRPDPLTEGCRLLQTHRLWLFCDGVLCAFFFRLFCVFFSTIHCSSRLDCTARAASSLTQARLITATC